MYLDFSAGRFRHFDLLFTDKEITAWGGMALMKRMLDHIGFGTALANSGLPPPGSDRGYAPDQLITQFMLSVRCGANRFEHGEVTHHDPAGCQAVAQEINTDPGTLKGWLKSPGDLGAAQWSAAQRLQALCSTHGMTSPALAAWRREKDLFEHQLQQWRTSFCDLWALLAPRPALGTRKFSCVSSKPSIPRCGAI